MNLNSPIYSTLLKNKFLILVVVSVHLRFWSLSRPNMIWYQWYTRVACNCSWNKTIDEWFYHREKKRMFLHIRPRPIPVTLPLLLISRGEIMMASCHCIRFSHYWPFVRETTGFWWIPTTKRVSNTDLYCFAVVRLGQTFEQTAELP